MMVITSNAEFNRLRQRELDVAISPLRDIDWQALKMGRMARNLSYLGLVPLVSTGRAVARATGFSSPTLGRIINGLTKMKYLR